MNNIAHAWTVEEVSKFISLLLFSVYNQINIIIVLQHCQNDKYVHAYYTTR